MFPRKGNFHQIFVNSSRMRLIEFHKFGLGSVSPCTHLSPCAGIPNLFPKFPTKINQSWTHDSTYFCIKKGKYSPNFCQLVTMAAHHRVPNFQQQNINPGEFGFFCTKGKFPPFFLSTRHNGSSSIFNPNKINPRRLLIT